MISAPIQNSKTMIRAAYGMLVLVCILAYSNTLHAPFIMDDLSSIVDNPNIRSLWPLTRSLSAPDESTVAGRPVAAFTLALNYAVSRVDPWSYHIFNIFVHILSALTIFGILRCTPAASSESEPEFGSGWALGATLLWAVHPLHTETVTYVSTRTELLAGLFYLVSLYCLIRGVGDSGKTAWQAGCVASCLLAMGSKEMSASLPVVLLLYDRIFLGGSWREVFRRRRILYAALAATWLILAGLIVGGPRSETVGLGFSDVTPLDYARTQAGVIWHYLRLAFWPDELVLDYLDWPIARSFSAEVVLASGALVVLAATAVWQALKGSRIGFLGCWFFLILAPSSSFIPIVSEIAAERRMYLPLIALIVLVLAGVHRMEKFLPENPGRLLRIALIAVLCILLIYTTYQRNQIFESQYAVWKDVLEKRPDNPRALANFGAVLLEMNRRSDAVPMLERALKLDPGLSGVFDGKTLTGPIPDVRIKRSSARALENLGLVSLEEGDLSQAELLLGECARLQPDDGVCLLNLAKVLVLKNEVDQAIRELREAVRLLPENALAHARLAGLMARKSEIGEAIELSDRAVRLAPDSPEVRSEAGKVYWTAGDIGTAIQHYTAAVRQDPDHPGYHLALGRLEAAAGRDRTALDHYLKALEIRPKWGEAGNSLAILYATSGDPEVRDPGKAVRIAREMSVAAGDRHPVLLNTLATALASAGQRSEALQTIDMAISRASEAGQDALQAQLEQQRDLIRQGWPPPVARP
ncbi:tetratricopeptide repeat protein [bacterium]|nr:tetratricopeptide repeat protein [candidate division CSSED10-310 bacterium]